MIQKPLKPFEVDPKAFILMIESFIKSYPHYWWELQEIAKTLDISIIREGSNKKKTNYRKPGNLMIRTILNKWNVDLKQSFMIGDRLSDKLAAKKSKLYFEYVSRNFLNQVKKIIEKMSNNY